jgi:hypothetical protein
VTAADIAAALKPEGAHFARGRLRALAGGLGSQRQRRLTHRDARAEQIHPAVRLLRGVL